MVSIMVKIYCIFRVRYGRNPTGNLLAGFQVKKMETHHFLDKIDGFLALRPGNPPAGFQVAGFHSNNIDGSYDIWSCASRGAKLQDVRISVFIVTMQKKNFFRLQTLTTCNFVAP